MKPLEVVTPLYIYHGFYTQKTFWEEIFTLENMKNCDRLNVRKHREIKNAEQYIVLDIYLKFGNLDKVKVTIL